MRAPKERDTLSKVDDGGEFKDFTLVATGFRETDKGQCAVLGLAIPGTCYHPEGKRGKHTDTEWTLPTSALIFAVRDGACLEGVEVLISQPHFLPSLPSPTSCSLAKSNLSWQESTLVSGK